MEGGNEVLIEMVLLLQSNIRGRAAMLQILQLAFQGLLLLLLLLPEKHLCSLVLMGQ